MKPYYDHNGITIYHGDCLEILPSLGEFDLLLTDPPYSISVAQDHVHATGKGTRKFNFFAGDTDWKTMTASVVERVSLAASVVSAAYVWCGHRQFGAIVDEFERLGFKTRFLVWKKECPVPAPPGVGWDSAAELCVYAFRAGRKWTAATGVKCPNVITADAYRFGQLGKVDHPTQKPLSVVSIPMRHSTKEGDRILDPYMGSGTTLVVAKSLGRIAVGIEREEKYCEIAAKRMAQEVMEFV